MPLYIHICYRFLAKAPHHDVALERHHLTSICGPPHRMPVPAKMILSHAYIALVGACAAETVCYNANQTENRAARVANRSLKTRDLRSDRDVIRPAKGGFEPLVISESQSPKETGNSIVSDILAARHKSRQNGSLVIGYSRGLCARNEFD